MAKNEKKKNEKKNGVTVIDNTETEKDSGNGKDSAEAARKALEALPEDQRAAVLKELGFTPKKGRPPKEDKGPDTRELFDAATEKIGDMAVPICNLLAEFPSPVAVTFERNTDGFFSASVKRVRKPYGPRKDKNDSASA